MNQEKRKLRIEFSEPVPDTAYVVTVDESQHIHRPLSMWEKVYAELDKYGIDSVDKARWHIGRIELNVHPPLGPYVSIEFREIRWFFNLAKEISPAAQKILDDLDAI